MNFLQKANVLHRDLKPQNIVVDDHLNVKIVDFGLARTMPESSEKFEIPTSKKERKQLAKRLD